MSMDIDLPDKLKYIVDDNLTEYYYSYLSSKDIQSFDKLSEVADIAKRNLYVLGEVTLETGIALENMIRFYNQLDEQLEIDVNDRIPIKIWINSQGGSLDAALTTCDIIEISTTPIITINQGSAASAAALIFLAGHTRITLPHSYFLLHEGSAGIGQIDAHKFQSFSDFYKIQREQLKKIILEKTILTESEYNTHAKDDWWIFANEAIDLKVADKIMTPQDYATL